MASKVRRSQETEVVETNSKCFRKRKHAYVAKATDSPIKVRNRIDLWGSFLFVCLFVFPFAFSRAAPAAHGGSQARGPVGAAGTGLRQSHSSVGSEPRLQPTPQLTATRDP